MRFFYYILRFLIYQSPPKSDLPYLVDSTYSGLSIMPMIHLYFFSLIAETDLHSQLPNPLANTSELHRIADLLVFRLKNCERAGRETQNGVSKANKFGKNLSAEEHL